MRMWVHALRWNCQYRRLGERSVDVARHTTSQADARQVPDATPNCLCYHCRCPLDRLDDLLQVVGHGDGAVGKGGACDAAAAQHLVELLAVGRVVGDRGGGVLELMAGEDADHALVGPITPSATSALGAGHAGGAGRLAAQAAGAHLGLGVENLLVAHLADHARRTTPGPADTCAG